MIRGHSRADGIPDAFSAADPRDAARVVRRALASAAVKAVEVTALVVVADRIPAPADLARFARRALGARCEVVRVHAIASDATEHETRRRLAIDQAASLIAAADRRPLVVAVALGPGGSVTAICLDADVPVDATGAAGLSSTER